jgi:hypothetical protein
MRPTSVELIERIAEALDQSVLPAVGDDKWAASVVRSATTLLAHLAKRIPLEAPVLLADNEDAKAVLSGLALRLQDHSPGDETAQELRSLGDAEPIPVYDAPALDTRNRLYQTAVERLLRSAHERAWTEDINAYVLGEIRQYLKRRMERERDIYFPAFTGPPF